jgi:DNA-binding GntR family transcriptional regulator
MRTSLIIGMFGMSGVSVCSDGEHSEILAAVRARDAEAAAAMMLSHLRHIEADIDLAHEARGVIDLKKAIG